MSPCAKFYAFFQSVTMFSLSSLTILQGSFVEGGCSCVGVQSLGLLSGCPVIGCVCIFGFVRESQCTSG